MLDVFYKIIKQFSWMGTFLQAKQLTFWQPFYFMTECYFLANQSNKLIQIAIAFDRLNIFIPTSWLLNQTLIFKMIRHLPQASVRNIYNLLHVGQTLMMVKQCSYHLRGEKQFCITPFTCISTALSDRIFKFAAYVNWRMVGHPLHQQFQLHFS